MNSGYELFSIGSVSVRIHGSFILLSVLMVLLAFSYGGTGSDVGLRLLGPLILFATVLLHELGHALAARRMGVPVIDIMLTPFGGAARLEGELRDPRQEGWIALAGPATNGLIAALTLAVMAALGRTQNIRLEDIVYFLEEDRTFLQQDLLTVVFGLNVLLAILNLCPSFPCDGGRVLRALLAARKGRLPGTRAACRIGLYMSLVLILLPLFLDGQQWWITPFVGFYFIFANLKERLSVEAREGLGISGHVFQFGRGFPPPQDNRHNEEHPAADDDPILRDTDMPVIDVTGTSRLVDDDRE